MKHFKVEKYTLYLICLFQEININFFEKIKLFRDPKNIWFGPKNKHVSPFCLWIFDLGQTNIVAIDRAKDRTCGLNTNNLCMPTIHAKITMIR